MHLLLPACQSSEPPKSLLRFCLGITLTILLSSCATNPYSSSTDADVKSPTQEQTEVSTNVPPVPAEPKLESTPYEYDETQAEQAARAQHYQEQAAQQENNEARIEAILSAAEHYIQANRYEQATELLGLIDQPFTRDDHFDRSLIVYAYSDYAQGYYQQALTRLAPLVSEAIDPSLVDPSQEENTSKIDSSADQEDRNYIEPQPLAEELVTLTAQQIDALLLASLCHQALGNSENSISTLIRRETGLSGSAKAETTRYIWQVINMISLPERESLAQNARDSKVRNRIQQSLVGKIGEVQNTPQQFNQWRDDTQNDDFKLLTKGEWNATSPRSIYVLLPLTSRYRKAANAVKSGIEREHLLNTSSFRPDLRFYDIGDNPLQIGQYYAAAINAGADYVIGPIGKNYSNEINGYLSFYTNQSYSSTPLLMMGGDTPLSNGAQRLSMSPELEGQRVAEKAWRDGHLSAGVLWHPSQTNERVLKGFKQKWLELGGKLNSTIEYSPQQYDHSNQLKQLFGVHASERRHRQLSSALGFTPKFSSYQRGDLDFVFLLANAKVGRVIRPQINFYTNSQISVYGTSSLYNGIVDEVNNMDLDSTVFPVMPWVVRSSDLSPYAGQLNMLYAMGMDSYRIAGNYGEFQSNPRYAIEGNTGTISLSESGELTHQPLWARFVQGKLEVLEDLGIDLTPLEGNENNKDGGDLNDSSHLQSKGSYNSENWDTRESRRKTGG